MEAASREAASVSQNRADYIQISAWEGRTQRILIIGAGFAGLAAAKALRNANADVLMIDRSNHNLFQPLLYQVATTALSLHSSSHSVIQSQILGEM